MRRPAGIGARNGSCPGGPPGSGLNWPIQQPSRLLDARSQVVPFVGRDTELERLRQWRDDGSSRLSVLLLHGPGGQRKNRLATRFAELSRGWHVAQAGFRTASLPANGTSTPADADGVLLVVDYADRWAHSELEQLLSDPVLNQQTPTRILLIGRTVRWFAALRGLRENWLVQRAQRLGPGPFLHTGDKVHIRLWNGRPAAQAPTVRFRGTTTAT